MEINTSLNPAFATQSPSANAAAGATGTVAASKTDFRDTLARIDWGAEHTAPSSVKTLTSSLGPGSTNTTANTNSFVSHSDNGSASPYLQSPTYHSDTGFNDPTLHFDRLSNENSPPRFSSTAALTTTNYPSTLSELSFRAALSGQASKSNADNATFSSGAPNNINSLNPQIQAAPSSHNVRTGDTVYGIAQNFLQSQGMDASPEAAMKAALVLSKTNNLKNPDRIFPGQIIQLGPLSKSSNALLAIQSDHATVPAPKMLSSTSSAGVNHHAPIVNKAPRAVSGSAAQVAAAAHYPPSSHPILERTLDRAVALKYIPVEDKGAIRNKIINLANEHGFSPDDLATVTLMESDGLNPRASNGHCHGVIQFCEGQNQGAASVGYAGKAKSIGQLKVLDQLDLVGRYFNDTGLRNSGRASLDNLYLTVLTPSARQEKNPLAPLSIPGQQATTLYENKNPSSSITRRSLLAGLYENALQKLGLAPSSEQKPAKGVDHSVNANPVTPINAHPTVNAGVNAAQTTRVSLNDSNRYR